MGWCASRRSNCGVECEREQPERLTIRVWLFPWLSIAAIGAIVAAMVAMLFTRSLATQLYASLLAAAVVLVACACVRSGQSSQAARVAAHRGKGHGEQLRCSEDPGCRRPANSSCSGSRATRPLPMQRLLEGRINSLVRENREIHESLCVNLNPATNVMNPKAEALLASGLGTRVSLGYPGDKYEMGLEAVEQIEVIAAELAAEIFGARFAEIRVQSGAMANLYAFMATCSPGDRIIVPPDAIGGHVTHHQSGRAGLYRLEIHEAPVDASGYTVDLDGLRALAFEDPAAAHHGGRQSQSVCRIPCARCARLPMKSARRCCSMPLICRE